jgi:hypothetical protein
MSDDEGERLDPIRRLLVTLAADKGVALLRLSRHVGRNDAYFAQYLKQNKPRVLPRSVREALGRFFGIDPNRFRGQDEDAAEPDRDLLSRAMSFTNRLLEDHPPHGALRAQVASTVYVLLQRHLISDDDQTMRLIKSMADGIYATLAPTDPPSDH